METIFTIIAMFIGCGVYAYNINEIGYLLKDMNKSKRIIKF